MSAFDDEFGLFGDEQTTFEEDENRSTLGARKIATGSEIVIDEIEPEDDEPARRRGGGGNAGGPRNFRRRGPDERRSTADPETLRQRGVELLGFLAKGLVSKPEVIYVEAHEDARQGMVLELEVAAEDLGKVIGRGGRVAQALRTVVRAGVEGRVAIEIIDVEIDDGDEGHDVALTVNDATEQALQDDGDDQLEVVAGDVVAEPFTPTLRAETVADAPARRPGTRRRGRPAAVPAEGGDADAAAPVTGDAPADPNAGGDAGEARRPRARRPRKAPLPEGA